MKKKSIKFKKRHPRDVIDILSEKLITDELESRHRNGLWNETQLGVIVNTITDAINVIANFYSYYPGNAIYLFKMVQEDNQSEDSNHTAKKRAVKYASAMDDKSFLWETRNTFYFLLRMSDKELILDEIFKMQLPRLQKKGTPISEKQLQEVHEILDYFLQNAINTLTTSPYYKKAKEEKHLYYHEPPIVIDGKRLNPPPSEEKKRKRQPTEPPRLTLQQSAEATFFSPRKKTKKSDSHETEVRPVFR